VEDPFTTEDRHAYGVKILCAEKYSLIIAERASGIAAAPMSRFPQLTACVICGQKASIGCGVSTMIAARRRAARTICH
jgi:hypothetical protein